MNFCWIGLASVGLLALLTTGCTGIPSDLTAVSDFKVDRYLGTWYEIARMDHRFERGLNNVSATYTLRGDGGIDVVNRGYDPAKEAWREAKGRAYLLDDSGEGRLKVSFFRPFYGGYNIIHLDHEKYAYAMVCGPDRSYFWILAREKKIDDGLLQELLAKAAEFDVHIDGLIFVEHDR